MKKWVVNVFRTVEQSIIVEVEAATAEEAREAARDRANERTEWTNRQFIEDWTMEPEETE